MTGPETHGPSWRPTWRPSWRIVCRRTRRMQHFREKKHCSAILFPLTVRVSKALSGKIAVVGVVRYLRFWVIIIRLWLWYAQYDSGQTFTGVTVTVHERYTPDGADWDVAVIRLPRPLTFNDHVQPVCIPSTPVADGTNCVVTGWGETQSTLNRIFSLIKHLSPKTHSRKIGSLDNTDTSSKL